MNKIIIEKVENCKLVKTRYVPNGHDCWGNSEFIDYEYVMVNEKIKDVGNSMYIIHDDKNVLGTGYLDHLDDTMQELLCDNFRAKQKEKRYQRYLELKKEFSKDPIYIRDEKISKVIDK